MSGVTTARIRPDRLARGAGRGLTVLLIGGLLAPAASYLPGIGLVWLALVALVAFAVAGSAIRDVPRPATHGALAALLSYLLVLPLVVMAARGLDPIQLIVTSVTAAGVGAAAGLLAQRGQCPSAW